VRVSARWWGDDLVADAARPWVGLDSARDADATFVFPVVAKPAGFARYCRDAAMLALEFADGRTGRVAAVASVDVSRLDLGRPVLGARALRTRGGATVGSVGVAMRVDFRPDRVSSFERNERLAEAEAAETRGERLDATSVDGGDASADAERRRRSGDDEEETSPKRSPKRRGRDVSSGDASRRAGAARARLRENPSLAESPRGRAARRRESLWERERTPRDAVEACELLRREIDEALALDGAEAARMIDEEIARASPSPPGREAKEARKANPGRTTRRRGFAVRRVGARRGVPNLESLRSLERRDDSVGARRRDGVAGRDRGRPGRRRCRRRRRRSVRGGGARVRVGALLRRRRRRKKKRLRRRRRKRGEPRGGGAVRRRHHRAVHRVGGGDGVHGRAAG
jgi:hypothetical protein